MARTIAALASALVLSSAIFSCSDSGHSKGSGGGAGESNEHEGNGGAGSDADDVGQGGDGHDPQRGSAGESSGGDASSEGVGGNGEVGSVPEQLVGVWQETRASGGDYTNSYGEDFSATSGFSVQLRIAENGSYQWSHYAAGVAPSCAHVSYFDRSAGVAVVEGDVLTLHPSKHEVDIDNCEVHDTREAALDPIRLAATVEDYTLNYGGLRTYLMHLDGGAQPFDLKLLLRPPLAMPAQPEQPADFSLGTDPPFKEMQGLWAASPGTDTQFFNAETGEFYFPELNGKPQQWLRFEGGAYEAAVALHNTNAEGVCKVDIIYYEQGKALLAVLEDIGAQGTHFDGHVRWEATAARLIERVHDCDQDDATYQYDLPGQLSYYGWSYFTPSDLPEMLTMNCKFPLSEWQSTLCTSDKQTFYRQ